MCLWGFLFVGGSMVWVLAWFVCLDNLLGSLCVDLREFRCFGVLGLFLVE